MAAKGQKCLHRRGVHSRTGEGPCADARVEIATAFRLQNWVWRVQMPGAAGEDFDGGAERNNLGHKVFCGWKRWDSCSLCRAEVSRRSTLVALGVLEDAWAGRRDPASALGNEHLDGLCGKAPRGRVDCGRGRVGHGQRLGASAGLLLQANLAITYEALGRPEACVGAYHGYLKLHSQRTK